MKGLTSALYYYYYYYYMMMTRRVDVIIASKQLGFFGDTGMFGNRISDEWNSKRDRYRGLVGSAPT